MKRTQKHYEIKNAVLLVANNAQKSCTKKEGIELFKLWVAAKKDTLREVLEDAFTPDETKGKDVFEFCSVIPASSKVIHHLREYGYDNPEDYVTFDIRSWNKPFECPDVPQFDDLLMQEFTITCDINLTSIRAKDDDGNFLYESNGQYKKTDAGCFSGSKYFVISDIDDELTFAE